MTLSSSFPLSSLHSHKQRQRKGVLILEDREEISIISRRPVGKINNKPHFWKYTLVQRQTGDDTRSLQSFYFSLSSRHNIEMLRLILKFEVEIVDWYLYVVRNGWQLLKCPKVDWCTTQSLALMDHHNIMETCLARLHSPSLTAISPGHLISLTVTVSVSKLIKESG